MSEQTKEGWSVIGLERQGSHGHDKASAGAGCLAGLCLWKVVYWWAVLGTERLPRQDCS